MADDDTNVPKIYCLKCKNHTTPVDTREEFITVRGKQRKQLCGTCSVCDKNVRKFVAEVCEDAPPPPPKEEDEPRRTEFRLEERLEKEAEREHDSE